MLKITRFDQDLSIQPIIFLKQELISHLTSNKSIGVTENHQSPPKISKNTKFYLRKTRKAKDTLKT